MRLSKRESRRVRAEQVSKRRYLGPRVGDSLVAQGFSVVPCGDGTVKVIAPADERSLRKAVG